MHTSRNAFMRKQHFVPVALAVGVLLFASVTLANVVFGTYSQNDSTDAANTQLTLSSPSSTVADDLLLATIVVNGGTEASVTPPSG